ncbi:ABC transporter ATP-binding protein [Peptococcaceae bacterium]|nr:ABC transporter ATP-binding protein [Peptococcaceae bacterium]
MLYVHWSEQKLLFEFKNIEYKINDNHKKISCFSLDVGQVLVIQGKSGSGKSTFLKVLAKLYPCVAGNVFLNNKNWHEFSCELWRSKVHYLPQKPILFNDTVYNNLEKPFTLKVHRESKKKLDIKLVNKLLSDLLLNDNILKQNAKTLSGGELARLAFIRSILIDPTVLLLDEPTASLDKKSKKAFYNVLSKWLSTQRVAIIVSHDSDFGNLKDIHFLTI